MKKQQSTPIAASSEAHVLTEARRWLMAIYAEGGSVDDVQFRAWLGAAPEHAQAYRALEQAWRDLPLSPALDIEVHKAPTRRVWSGSRPWLAAASLLLCVALGLWFGRHGAPEGAVTTTYATALAEMTTVRLADGSTVTLGANSRITAAFDRTARAITLERGTAYFDIAHDASRPASVTAANAHLRVVGTAFEVWTGPSGVRLSVVRGRVAVDAGGAQTDAANAPAASLGAGQQVTIKADGSLTKVTAFAANDLLSWRSGRLVYRDAALADIVSDLNRYRPEPIQIRDSRAASLRVTAAFAVGQGDQVLAGLAASRPIRLQKSGTAWVISASP